MPEMFGVGILGMAACLPPRIRENDFWDGKLRSRADRRKDFLAVEQSATQKLPPEVSEAMALLGDDPFRGARTRYVLPDEMDVSDLEAEAVRRALRASGTPAADVDLVIVHSVVQDHVHPTNGPAIVDKCGLVHATAWDLDVACASFIGAMIAATGLVRAEMYRRIVIVTSAVWSRIIDYASPQSVSFGDAAAAAVVGPVSNGFGVIGHWSRTDGSKRNAVVVAPTTAEGKLESRWVRGGGAVRLGSLDIEMGRYLGIHGPEYCREACIGALDSAGLTVDDVAVFAGGQTLGWFVDGCRRGLGLPRDKALDTFAEVGNIGSAAIVHNLERAAKSKRLREGDVVLMYLPGAGFTRSSLVYRWHASAGVS